jgi:acetyl esterase/lipase
MARMFSRRYGVRLISSLCLTLLLSGILLTEQAFAQAHPQVSSSIAAPDSKVPARNARYTLKTVTYCNGFQMDIYTPIGTNHPVPVVEYVHGGGWSWGSRTTFISTEARTAVNLLLSKGFIVTSIDYQLGKSGNRRYPDNIMDVTCSIRFLRTYANTYKIDPKHIGLFGDSAGGQLVSLAGLAGDARVFHNGVYPGVSSRVQAVEDLFGPTISVVKHLGRSSQANPVNWVSQTPGSDPPFLILQGSQDTTVYPRESQDLYHALTAAGQPVTLQMVQNAGHEFVPTPAGATLKPSPSQICAMMLNFFVQNL